MKIIMDEDDFDHLTHVSAMWDGRLYDQGNQRFASLNGEPVNFTYKWVHWCANAASMILVKSWLDSEGHGFQVLMDQRDGDYAVVTDFSNGMTTEEWSAVEAAEAHIAEAAAEVAESGHVAALAYIADGAKTLSEAIVSIRAFADDLERMRLDGYKLVHPVEDGHLHLDRD